MSVDLYSAIKRSLTGRFLVYIVQFVSLAVYARLFSPEQFGIIASIQVFLIFFQMIAEIGIGPAIINEKEFKPNQRDGVFTFTFLLGVALSLFFYMLSFLLKSFYDGYDYQSIAWVVSLSVIFSSLCILPTTALTKDGQFIRLGKAESLAELCSFCVVYVLYLFDFGELALASKTLAQSFFKFVIIRRMSSNSSLGRSSFGKEIWHVKKLASFATYQFGFNLINYFSRNLDKILIAKFMGPVSLGVYDKSYQLMRYPLMLTTFALSPAIQPTLTKVRHDVDQVIYEHNRLGSRLLFISILISVFLNQNSEDIVLIIFGTQWIDVVPLINLFSLMIPTQAVLSTSGAFFQVMNKPRMLFISGLLSAIVNIVAICIGVYLGEMKYIAISLVLAFAINFFQAYFILFNYCFNRPAYSFYVYLLKSISLSLILSAFYIILKIMFISSFALSSFQGLFVNFITASIVLVIGYKFYGFVMRLHSSN